MCMKLENCSEEAGGRRQDEAGGRRQEAGDAGDAGKSTCFPTVLVRRALNSTNLRMILVSRGCQPTKLHMIIDGRGEYCQKH